MGDVISQSFGATENTFPGFSQGNFSSLLNLRYAFKDALAHHVTVLAASGDDGATDAESDGSTLYPFRVNSWPSSDPLVSSIGGSQLTWTTRVTGCSPTRYGTTGSVRAAAGSPAVFSRPLFQTGVRGVVGGHRGTPDISMSAAVNGGCWVYMSFAGIETPGVSDPGWYIFGGTSEATPIFSGIVALADQVAGHRLGLINPALYALGAASQHGVNTGLVDITAGNNSFGGRHRVQRWPGLRPGQRVGHDQRRAVRAGAGAHRLPLGTGAGAARREGGRPRLSRHRDSAGRPDRGRPAAGYRLDRSNGRR